ncbi:hypothetical protein KIL84_022017 [Mauremys mutica]|uniref:Uncharacterized protein n=1 Tax=Mauremys mutica TaxID=74926 RepID=A0A9D3XF70_9SAUR|nr:hypothetical protein KIL84_022017 [Mauremys mutica]
MEAGDCRREPVEAEGGTLETPSCSRVRVSSPVGFGHWGGDIGQHPLPAGAGQPSHARDPVERMQAADLPSSSTGASPCQPATALCSQPEHSAAPSRTGVDGSLGQETVHSPGRLAMRGTRAAWSGPEVYLGWRPPESLGQRSILSAEPWPCLAAWKGDDVVSPRGDGSRGMPGIQVGQGLWRTPSSIGA